MTKRSDQIGRCVVLARIVLFFVACVAMLIVATPVARLFPKVPLAISIGVASSFGALALTLVFVRWDGVSAHDVGAAPDRHSVSRLAAGFVLGLLLVAINTLAMWCTGHVTWIWTPAPNLFDAAVTLVVFLLLASREELAFHGYPLRRLESVYGEWVAQAVVALIFALEHVAGGSSWANAFIGSGVGSLLFGMAAIASRGLALPIGLHAAWNFGDWLRGGKDSVGVWKAVVDEAFAGSVETAGMVSYVVLFLLTTLSFWRWHRISLRSGDSRN